MIAPGVTMSSDTDQAENLTSPRRGVTVAGIGLIVLLFAVSVGLVLPGGSYAPYTWLPLMAAVAGLALVIALAGPAVFSGRYQKILLAVFALQAVWTAASVFWADSQANAWEETNRTLFYALTLALAFTAVRWAGPAGLRAVAVAVLVVSLGVAAWLLVALNTSSHPLDFFSSGRLYFPITYFNGLAALLMVGFWLALGLANGPRCAAKRGAVAGADDAPAADAVAAAEAPEAAPETTSRVAWRRSQAQKTGERRFPRWTQPLLLVLAVVLAEAALLPQSRGAFWAFFLVLPFFVIFSPHRFRALIDVVIVAAPIVLFWNRLNAPYLAISNDTPLGSALTTQLITVGYSAAVVVGAWLITWLIERWIGPLSRKATVWISVVLAALAIFAAAGGIVYADIETGGLDGYLTDRWQEITDDGQADAAGGTRFGGVGLNGRWRTWKIAVDAYEQEPLLGIGAQNFEAFFYQHRPMAFTVRQPHSQPLQLLAELGLPGVILWVVFVLATLLYAAIVRFRSTDWGERVLVAAMMTAVISWFIHSSADWLWQLAGVTLPVIVLFGALIGAGRGPKPRPAAGTAGTAATEALADPAAPIGTVSLAESQLSATPRAQRTRRSSGSGRSVIVRGLAVVIAVVALASAALPYASLRYSALAAGTTDLELMTSRAQTAATLDPTSIEPFISRAAAYSSAATAAPDAVGRMQLLRQAADVWLEAVEIEPHNWVCRLNAAEALVAAGDAALVLDRMLVRNLRDQARAQLDEARRLNPLSEEIKALEAKISTSL